MSINKMVFTVIITFLVLQGCTNTIGIKANPTTGQITRFEAGTEVVISEEAHTLVAVRPENQNFESNKKPSFIVTIYNGTTEPLDFSTDNISAACNKKSVKIFTYDELVAEVKKQRRIAAIAAALSSVGRSMQAANAGRQHHYGTYSANTYGNVNGSSGSASYSGSSYGSYSGYSYDAGAAQRAQALAQMQTDQDFRQIKETAESALNSLSSTVLRKQTVSPNKWHGGQIMLDELVLAEDNNSLLLTVNVAGESHLFHFLLSETE